MKRLLYVYYYFIKLWLIDVFVKTPRTKEQYAAKNLFNTSFRMNEASRKDSLLVLRIYHRLIKELFKYSSKKEPFICDAESYDKIIYDATRKSFESRKDFVNHFFKEGKVTAGIFKNELFNNIPLSQKIAIMFLATLWTPFLFVFNFFRKDKVGYSLLLFEFVEVYRLIESCKQLKVKEVFFFCIYEKDANITALLLNHNNIIVNKITSETPLSFWNKIIIADKIYLCSAYQLDEVEKYKETIFTDKIYLWGPEKIMVNYHKYSQPTNLKKQNIGFYSTAGWLRKLQGHIEQKVPLDEKEEMVKFILKEFCKNNTQYKLTVFLHPKERIEKVKDLVIDKYKKDFEGINYTLCSEISALSFEEAALAVAFFSTIVFERLYYGFKTLIMPMGLEENFPIQGSSMKNICAYSEKELYNLIENNIKLSNQEFFDNNNLNAIAKFINN